MIRPATPADLPAMLRMARDFARVGAPQLPWDAAYADASLRAHLATPERLSLVLEASGAAHGMLCAAWVDSPLAPVRLAQELVFWIDPDHRGRWAREMISAYEAWAREGGCHAAALVALPDTATGRLYDRLGYHHAEQVWSRDF